MSVATPCTQCQGHCCTRYSIEVTVHDLVRIATALDVPAASLCDTVPSWKGRCPIVPSLIGGRPVNLVVSKVETGCRFYRDGVGANCAIYPVRPGSCAVFPYFGGADLVLQRDAEVLPCPAPWLPEHRPPTVATDLDVLMADIGVHNRLVDDLNGRVDDSIELTGYLELLLEAFGSHRASPAVIGP